MSGSISDKIQPDDQLGREERFRTEARKAFSRQNRKDRGHARARKFKPPRGTNEISVNRMGLTSDAKMAEIGVQNAAFDNERKFWGWYKLSAQDIKDAGCSVKPSPTHTNLYYADIIIPVPLDLENRKDELNKYAYGLAERTVFCPWGDWVDETR